MEHKDHEQLPVVEKTSIIYKARAGFFDTRWDAQTITVHNGQLVGLYLCQWWGRGGG